MKELFAKILAIGRRKHKRYKVHDGVTVVIGPRAEKGDQIVDIGLGGLTFLYDDRQGQLPEAFDIAIFIDGKAYLKNLKVKLVSNIQAGDIAYSSKNLRRVSVQFASLTPVEEFDLKALIKKHGLGAA